MTIPYNRAAEVCCKLSSYILAIHEWALFCQVHCHDTIATCHSNEGLLIISCLSIDNTIPIVLLTECSIKLTIYSYALWILWALLGQVQSHNAIATTCQWEGLYIITCYCIFYAIPNIWILAELSTKLSIYILAWSIWSYRDSINCCELHEHAALSRIYQLSELIVSYLYNAHAILHLIAVLSYRSSILAVCINLRSNYYCISMNIVSNEEVDCWLAIQTCDVQLIELVQLYIRQFHHLPIQYLYVLALFWAARLFWCWRLWIIWLDNQLASGLHVYVARVILWQILFQAINEHLHLFDWEILFATINHFLQILMCDIFLTFLQYRSHTTCNWEILLIVIENLLCIYVWDVVTIFLNQGDCILERNIFFLSLENFFQLCYREVFLVVIHNILDTCDSEVIAICLKQQIYLTKWDKLSKWSSLEQLNHFVINLIGCQLTEQHLQLAIVDIFVVLTYIFHYLFVGKYLVEVRTCRNIHSLLNAQQCRASRRNRCQHVYIHILATINEVHYQILAILQLIEEVVKIYFVPFILVSF